MFFLLIPVLIYYVVKKIFFPLSKGSLAGKHVVITGGSSGIGKSVAVLAAKQGAHVTIIARNLQNLNLALTEVQEACVNTEQKIQSLSADVTNYTLMEEKLLDIDTSIAPIYMLVNCAGKAVCAKLEDISVDDIKSLVDLNFLGTVYPIKAIVPKMKQRKNGIIVIAASQAALVGIFGFTAYSGSKFALRGFAEALDMELKVHGVSVTVAVPPDTDTPGFEKENKSKPIETSEICQTGGLFKPDDVAKRILDDALAGSFFSYMGFESYIVTTLCIGMTKFTSVVDVLMQFFLLGLLRIVACIYLASFDRIIKKCYLNEHKNK